MFLAENRIGNVVGKAVCGATCMKCGNEMQPNTCTKHVCLVDFLKDRDLSAD